MTSTPRRAVAWRLGTIIVVALAVAASPLVSFTAFAQSTLAPGTVGLVANTGGEPVLLRETPSFDAAVLSSFVEGTPVDIVEGPVYADDGVAWLGVSAGGMTGYIVAGYLADGGQAPASETVELAQAAPTEASEELRRVMPVIEAVAKRVQVPLSVDTTKAAVARAAVAAGAEIVNDVSGGLFDPAMPATVAELGAAYIVGHLRGGSIAEVFRAEAPVTLGDVIDELAQRIAAVPAGARVLVDPGLGFGKSTRLDLALLRDLDRLCALGFPVLLACSHKEVTADASGLPEDDVRGTLVAAALAARAGVAMLRLHDVAELAPAVRLADAVRRVEGP